MISFAVFTAALAALGQLGRALPHTRDSLSKGVTPPSEMQILNFALTLEHLEVAYYSQGLAKYSDWGFDNASYPPGTYARFLEIASHEKAHVQFLETVLGNLAVQPCEYSFPDTNVSSFVFLSYEFETVGVAAYAGALGYLGDPNSIAASAAILAVEARQAGWVNSALEGENPWNTAFDTPLTMNHVWTLASPMIVSCPATNAPLPVEAYPALHITGDLKPGAELTASFKATSTSGLYVAFLSGLNSTSVPLPSNHTFVLPDHLIGTVFAFIVNDTNQVSDSNTVAGPTLIHLPFGPGEGV